jgi:FkbM family methyltransferase
MDANALKKWKELKGDSTYRLNYDLNVNSVVFDVGGYQGWFTDQIYNKYKCNVYVFEPVLPYYEKIKQMFKGNNKVKVFPFGLSYKNNKLDIIINADSTSAYRSKKEGAKTTIELKNFNQFLQENKIEKIDLLKLNIEGEEFPLLDSIIKTGDINKINNIQVQFHRWIDNSIKLRSDIQNRLKSTHKQDWNFEFVWENWSKNN